MVIFFFTERCPLTAKNFKNKCNNNLHTHLKRFHGIGWYLVSVDIIAPNINSKKAGSVHRVGFSKIKSSIHCVDS